MGLLNYYDDTNKVEHTALKLWLAQTYHFGSYYRFSRTVTKTYSYVGMDKATALTCAYAKQAQYQYHEGLYNPDIQATERKLVQGANVEAVHDDGGMWHVDINVDVNDRCAFSYEGQGEPSIAYINSKFELQDFDEDENSPLNGYFLGDGNSTPEPIILERPSSGEGGL